MRSFMLVCASLVSLVALEGCVIPSFGEHNETEKGNVQTSTDNQSAQTITTNAPLQTSDKVWFVEIDDSFADNQKQDIMSALDTWKKATEGSFEYIAGNYSSDTLTWESMQASEGFFFVIHNSFAQAAQSSDAGLTDYNSNNQAFINLYLSQYVADDLYTKVVIHELGHALHLTHYKYETTGNSIMVPDLLSYSSHAQLTNEDIGFFCSVQYCNSSLKEDMGFVRSDYDAN